MNTGPEELGKIRWSENFQEAVNKSESNGRPLLVLFNEVPGCSTVLSYGRRVLSHPLIVEAVQDLFVPVVVYNNVGGAHREVLESFGEPTRGSP